LIIVTGAFGFIGSCLVERLNHEGYDREIVVVDDFYKDYKADNLEHKSIRDWIHRDLFIDWFKRVAKFVDFVYHIGARTDTAEMSVPLFDALNLDYSKAIWNICTEYQIPLIYASSAATYGDGQNGFSDDHRTIGTLKPLNPYGDSKHQFDLWALKQKKTPPVFYGLKFFNVYGPNEYHKGRMASVMFHATNQIRSTGKMKLFRSHREDCKDGQQKRDFVYVRDVLEMIIFLQKERPKSGIYNIGTGKARTFEDLVSQIFVSLGMKKNIEFIDIPRDIRETYQYFTEAEMSKLRAAGYTQEMTSLEDGIHEYVSDYLLTKKYY
jgi:ADP-L-glycero-D-manno-heptose 6-epimerase